MADILLKIDEKVMPNLAKTIMKKTGKYEPLTIPQFAEEIESIEAGELIDYPTVEGVEF